MMILKKTVCRASAFLAMFILMLLMPVSVKAAVTYAPKYSLKNVTKAEQPEGEWIKKKGKKRFRQEDGTLIKNRWISWNDKIYYLNREGIRAKGWVVYRGRRYYLKKRVLLTRTFFKVGKKYYYAGKKGYILKNRWVTVNEDRYYLDANGCRVKGEQYIDGKWYYFRKNGKLDPTKKVTPTIDPKKPMVALTFDDGPGPYTDTLLNCLHKYNARATFFMVGTSVPSYAATVRKMVQYKCELGNHSDTHPEMTSLSSAGIAAQFSACGAKIRAACGHSPTVCRLPYGSGQSSSWVLNSTGLPSIYWSVDTRDWANTGNPQHTINSALSEAKSGAIILMHDIHKSTVTAALTIIPTLVSRGYQLVTVSELAKYKGKINLSAGRTYYNFY